MRKFTYLLLTALLFALLTACGAAQEGAMTDEEEIVPVENVSTEIDTQLADESAAPAENVVNESEAVVPVDQVQPPALPETASPELLALLPAYDESDIQETATGLQYVIFEEGSGDAPVLGDTVIAHYTGYLTDGSKFDSSRDRGATFDFPIGRGQVIPGWDQGFALMTPGTKALLIIPSQLAYGPGGQGGIPPNATLYFDVELVDVIQPRQMREVDANDYTIDDSGVEYFDFTVGDGEEAAENKVVEIDFALWDLATGEIIGSSEQIGQPLSFRIGGAQMFQALQDGVRGMLVGGSRQVYIPAALLQDANLPQNSDVMFEVDLLSVRDGGPTTPTEVADGDYTDLESGIRYADVVVGEGDVLTEGAFVNAEYTAWLEDGTLFDSSIDSGQSLQFAFGQAPIPGLNEGLVDITVGSTRQIYVPTEIIGNPDLGNVLFEVQILGAEAP